jgi:hypothetical protein
VSRAELEQVAREVGAKLAAAVSEKHPDAGFALLVFDFGDRGSLAYVSNAQREDMFGSFVHDARMDLADRIRQLGLKIGAPR